MYSMECIWSMRGRHAHVIIEGDVSEGGSCSGEAPEQLGDRYFAQSFLACDNVLFAAHLLDGGGGVWGGGCTVAFSLNEWGCL